MRVGLATSAIVIMLGGLGCAGAPGSGPAPGSPATTFQAPAAAPVPSSALSASPTPAAAPSTASSPAPASVLASVPAPSPARSPEPPSVTTGADTTSASALAARIRARAAELVPGEVAVAVVDLATGVEAGINQDLSMHAASTMKVPVMLELFRQADEGRFSLDDPVVVKNEFTSIADGSRFLLTTRDDSEKGLYELLGQTVPLRELIRRMIVRSSNLSTNLLIELAGPERIQATLRGLDAEGLQVLRGVQDIPAFERGLNNMATARSLARVMVALGRCAEYGAERSEPALRPLTTESCREMIQILSGQEFRAQIPAGLPQGTRVAHKTGSITRIQHDAALVYPPGLPPYALVVMTRGFEERRAATRTAADISRLVWETLVEGGAAVESLDRQGERRKPAAVPERWRGVIGEYDGGQNVAYILESEQRLHALIDSVNYPLEEVGEDLFRLAGQGRYAGEVLAFERDGSGEATRIRVARAEFPRRKTGIDGTTFKIVPVRPVADLLPEALAANPPTEMGDFLEPDLVEISTLDPTIRMDIRYASTNNFMNAAFYREARAFLQRPAAEAVLRAHRKLREQGLGLLVYDAYRPWYVTRMFWDATPEAQKIFVADPSRGSRHNRGAAVDLTLYDLATGQPVEMVSGYDEFTDRAFPDYPGGTSLQRWYRELLRETMEAEGFRVYEAEWWHFDFQGWERYPLLNLAFERLGGGVRN